MDKSFSDTKKIGWRFDNTYTSLPKTMMSKLKPTPVRAPKLVVLNHDLAGELGLDFSSINDEQLSLIFSGNLLPNETECIAQAYAGHQFGHFTILGDGRAIVLGEHISKKNIRFDIQFKGSGKTPYSRNADGRAALGPMLREYIISEAINSLKIPTTRSLAVVKTGENVIRETSLPGAILTRVASSHIRVGTFQYAAINEKEKNLIKLFNYTINRHYPDIKNSKNQAIDLLKIVIEKQSDLVANWMRVGFIHGVMNTDNVSISGETIDYGPCAFMDTYNPETVFSSIDQNGRYSFFNQPGITKWNLARFAECLLPLIDANKDKAINIATEIINQFDEMFNKKWLNMMRKKIGLSGEEHEDKNLINELLSCMQQNNSDFTNTFYNLINDDIQNDKIYKDPKFLNWNKKWKERLKRNNGTIESSKDLMYISNPIVIPRNYKVEEVLDSATNDNNYIPMHKFLEVLKNPYNKEIKNVEYRSPPPASNKIYRTFCGT